MKKFEKHLQTEGILDKLKKMIHYSKGSVPDAAYEAIHKLFKSKGMKPEAMGRVKDSAQFNVLDDKGNNWVVTVSLSGKSTMIQHKPINKVM